MKFDDRPQNNVPTKQTITPQSAMDAYFDDMFASSVEDPLKNLSAQKDAKRNEASKRVPSANPGHKTAPKQELKPKKQKSNFNAFSFDEPEIKTVNISPLIIPAAFPKLAPVQVKPKLDAKTALAILEKQKSKLTIAQQERLKEKLKFLNKAKQEPVSKADIIERKIITSPEKVTPLNVPNKTIDVTPTKVTEPIIVASSELVSQKSHKPDWANSRFECLIFSVAGLKLAVPLISLGAIYKIEKEFIPLVGRASWFMGLYHHLERNVRVIDTAQWVMPERCSAEVRAAYKFIIRLGGNDWGMACDAVHQSIQLSSDQVKWRTERTKRAWLFGTVIDHMCALIDADSLSTMLEQQATKNPRVFSQ